ncbi:right-handed parallel beta-helix repeat-containing protein [candidate division KSB1 bacterium]
MILSKPHMAIAGFFLLFLSPLFTIPTHAGNATIPGKVTTPYPTIINLAVEWAIEGDENQDGFVDVRYRPVGENRWRDAMQLRRVPAGESRGTTPIFKWDNKHSGSIFDLKPDTEYEINLNLTDPDGGAAEKTVRVKTRSVPKPMPDAPVKEATPKSFKEVWATAAPGEIIELTYGFYRQFQVDRDGFPGKPIVIRAKEGGAVFDGISMRGRKHVYLDGLNSWGSIDLLEGEHLTVRRCTVSARYGIIARQVPGAKNCYIADNVVIYRIPWKLERMGHLNKYGAGANVGEGIQITGPGNVICHNYVKGFRDCISTMEDRQTAEQVCIDIYNNDVYSGCDDGIEADFCMHNCRVLRNRLTNCYKALSSQPSLGGPTYYIRNVMYNLAQVSIFFSRYSIGNVVLHNTAVKAGDAMNSHERVRPWFHTFFRNNLFIGGTPSGIYGTRVKGMDYLMLDREGRVESDPERGQLGGDGLAVYLPGADPLTCDFDYDAVGTYLTPFKGLIGDCTFDGIDELRERTTEKHVVQVDMTIFNNVVFPSPLITEREPPDLRPLPGSAVVDAGLRLANVNNGFLGKGPDIGAYEAGQKMPHYGPRPAGVDEETM